VALLYVKQGKATQFEEYEAKVLPLLKKFKGRLEHRIQVSPKDPVIAQPREIHVLSFEKKQDFEAYKSSDERLAYQSLLEEWLERADIFEGTLF